MKQAMSRHMQTLHMTARFFISKIIIITNCSMPKNHNIVLNDKRMEKLVAYQN